MRKNPCIIIPGLGQSKADLLDANGNFIKKAWPFALDAKQFGKELAVPYGKSVLFKKDAGFSKTIYKIFSSLLEPLTTLPNATFKYNVVTVKSEMPLCDCSEGTNRYIHKLVPIDKLCEKIGEKNVYFFSFNAFGEAFNTAKLLDEFIQKVKKETGSEKVDLLAFSLGGPVTIAYFDLFAQKSDIDRVVYLVAALDGSPLIADVLKDNIDKTGGEALMSFFFPKSMIKKIMGLMNKLTEETRLNTIEQVILGSLDTSVRYAPLVWGLVPNEIYEKTRDAVLSGSECTKLREKTDAFYETRKRTPKLLKNAEENGIKFLSISGNGHKFMPIAWDKDTLTDTVLTIESSCPGAKRNADGSIDMSSCLFSQTSYIIDNMSHNDASKNEKAGDIIADFLTKE